MGNSTIIIYQTENGNTKIETRLENETVWLTQAQMSELFGKDRTVITKHINNIFDEQESDEKSNVQILHIANSDRPISVVFKSSEGQLETIKKSEHDKKD